MNNVLDQLCKEVAEANKKWWIDIHTGHNLNRNVGELLMLVTSELAEALEGDRKNLQDDKLPQYKMFDVEIVDALIRLFDIAGHLIPNVQEIYDAKMKFNSIRIDHTRAHRLTNEGKKY